MNEKAVGELIRGLRGCGYCGVGCTEDTAGLINGNIF
jgi:hypothetical protein